jgi:hypothetical protein
MTRSDVVETEIYYKQGRKKRRSYFCHDPSRPAYSTNDDCYHNYLDEIGFLKLQVAGYYDKAYLHILSIFLSSPPL